MSTATRPTILVIDDREDITRFCERSLGGTFEFRHVTAARAADAVLRSETVAAVLLDRDFSRADSAGLLAPPEDKRNEGLHILRWLRREHPQVPVLMVTANRELQAALQAADLGADFLAWEDVTADPRVLEARLHQALEASGEGHQEAILARFRGLGIVTESPAFSRALAALFQAIPGRAPILLLGETGTGKDSLASAVHSLSGDPLRPWVSVNVASLNPNIIESELFGHARGAFTGAERTSIGKLRYAHGGTLFLNEIGDLGPEIQVKLLTVLERHEVVPVGEVKSYPAEFRLITATSRDLPVLVESGHFRRDLFHRIAWHTIEIPPLRERREDVPALAHAFLRATAQHRDGTVFGIAREAVEYLQELPWGGNVRELRGAVEAATASARHMITVADVREIVRRRESIFAPERRAGAAATVHVGAPPVATRPAEPASAAPAAPPVGGEHLVAPPGAAHPGAPAARLDASVPASHQGRADCESAVFGSASYRELTAAYFRFLLRKTAGRLSDVARLAGISKATAYEWKDRYGEGNESDRP